MIPRVCVWHNASDLTLFMEIIKYLVNKVIVWINALLSSALLIHLGVSGDVPARSWRGSLRICPVLRRCSIGTCGPGTLSSATVSRSSPRPCCCNGGAAGAGGGSSAGPSQSRLERWSWSCRRPPEQRRGAPRSNPHSWTWWQLWAASPRRDPNGARTWLLLSSPCPGANASGAHAFKSGTSTWSGPPGLCCVCPEHLEILQEIAQNTSARWASTQVIRPFPSSLQTDKRPDLFGKLGLRSPAREGPEQVGQVEKSESCGHQHVPEPPACSSLSCCHRLSLCQRRVLHVVKMARVKRILPDFFREFSTLTVKSEAWNNGTRQSKPLLQSTLQL